MSILGWLVAVQDNFSQTSWEYRVKLFSTLTLVLLTLQWIRIRIRRWRMNLPFVEGGYPLFGQVFTMVKGSPWDTMAQWVHRYGTMYCFHLFGTDAVAVADPDALKVILQTRLKNFRKDVQGTYKPFMVLLGKGLVTSEGDEWRRQRTLLAHTLKIDILNDVPAMAVDAVARLCAKLDAAAVSGESLDMAEEFRHLTLQVIARAILSVKPDESDATFAHMYLPIVEEGHKRTWNPVRAFLPGPAMWKFNRDVHALNTYVTKIIEDRFILRQKETVVGRSGDENTGRGMDILDKTMGAIDPNTWNEEHVEQIRDEVKTFILAGHETSASMLTWSLFEATQSRDVMTKILEEGRSVYRASALEALSRCIDADGDCDAAASREVLKDAPLDNLSYTEACLKESLRKYSVVPTVVRVATEDIQIKEHFIARGTTLMINIQGVHHNPDFWPKPLEYIPQRFHKTTPKPYTFLPFVEGARSCLGQFLSLLESKIVLSLLLQRYDFESVDPKASAAKHPFMVPIIPKTGHFMKVKYRSI